MKSLRLANMYYSPGDAVTPIRDFTIAGIIVGSSEMMVYDKGALPEGAKDNEKIVVSWSSELVELPDDQGVR